VAKHEARNNLCTPTYAHSTMIFYEQNSIPVRVPATKWHFRWCQNKGNI